MSWLIDSRQVVHRAFCRDIEDDIEDTATPYAAALIDGRGGVISLPKTEREMAAHLARPDWKDSHEAASFVRPCALCVGSHTSRDDQAELEDPNG